VELTDLTWLGPPVTSHQLSGASGTFIFRKVKATRKCI
jgi:hypothetical protein